MKPAASSIPEGTSFNGGSAAVTPLISRRTSATGLAKIHLRGHLNYREIVTRFERQSTFHGISHASLAPNTKWRVIWYTAFTVCLCALLVQIVLLIIRYRSYAKTVDLDMEAYANVLKSGAESYGVAAALRAHGTSQARGRRSIRKRRTPTKRYHPVYASCACDVDPVTGERTIGRSCYPLYKGNFSRQPAVTLSTRCTCQYDLMHKVVWPCFPISTWERHVCAECSPDLGNCPRKFDRHEHHEQLSRNHRRSAVHGRRAQCLCQAEYNHCLRNAQNEAIWELRHDEDFSKFQQQMSYNLGPSTTTTTTTTTTQAPELKKALGFEVLKDEIAIKTQAQQNLMFAVGGLPDNKKQNLSYSKDEFILKCSFNQQDCDIESNFTIYYDHTYGNCFTFNWDRSQAVTAHRTGANYGLRVLLYANVDEYLPTSESAGFRITVHDKWNVPFPDAFGYSAPTGFLSSFGVRMKQFNRIPAPHGQCLDGGEESPDFLFKDFNYSVEGCYRSCTQKEVVRICGCADPSYPRTTGSEYCKVSDPVARECIKDTSKTLGRLIAEGNVPNCVCHQPCRETNYAVTYSAARWPSGTAKVMECAARDEICLERYRKNAAMLHIFYEELNYETLTEAPAYTLASALADLGGLTGLWIGASVVSLLEIVALIVYTAQAYVRNKKIESNSSNALLQKSGKRSHSSSVSKRSMKDFRKSPALSGKFSKHSLLAEEDERDLEMAQDDKASSHAESGSLSRPKARYLAPGEELPCECVYNAEGRIEYMKALCPEHGYLVRRRGVFDEDEEEEEEEDEEEEENEEEEDEEDEELGS